MDGCFVFYQFLLCAAGNEQRYRIIWLLYWKSLIFYVEIMSLLFLIFPGNSELYQLLFSNRQDALTSSNVALSRQQISTILPSLGLILVCQGITWLPKCSLDRCVECYVFLMLLIFAIWKCILCVYINISYTTFTINT